jgi:hypothetical protein
VLHVVVMPPVSSALRGMPIGRDALVKTLNRLYDQLGRNADHYRSRRDPDDPDLFDYVVHLFDGASWHTFRFSVDDRQANDGYLFVVAVSHRMGKG